VSWVVTCTQCGKSAVYESGGGTPDVCPACAEKGKKEVKRFLEKEQKRRDIIAVGSAEVGPRKIKGVHGVVSDERIFGMGLARDLDLDKFNGGIALTWTEKIKKARELCIRSLEDEAIERGANAVVGIDLCYEALGTHNGMLMILVAAKGTAVTLE
jgi:uncharacterized protein YbjQ (UPF0145 family)